MNKFIRGWYSGKLFSAEMCNQIRGEFFQEFSTPYEYGLGVTRGPKNCFGHAGMTFGFQSYISHTTNDYSFAIGIDDAAVSVFEFEILVADILLGKND